MSRYTCRLIRRIPGWLAPPRGLADRSGPASRGSRRLASRKHQTLVAHRSKCLRERQSRRGARHAPGWRRDGMALRHPHKWQFWPAVSCEELHDDVALTRFQPLAEAQEIDIDVEELVLAPELLVADPDVAQGCSVELHHLQAGA